MSNYRNKRHLAIDNEMPSKKQRFALYLDDNTPVRTIEVNNIAEDVTSAYLKGYFEHAAGRVSNAWIVNKPIRKAFVTFALPEDAAKLFCEPKILSDYKFTIKQADTMYQPTLNPNSLRFEEIIDDCLLKIASYLKLSDIINLGKSSTRLQSLTQLIYRTKTHFAFGTNTGDSSINESNVEAALQEMGQHIRSVKWYGLRMYHLQYLLANCPNVTELYLINPSHVLQHDVILRNQQFFWNLETLKLVRSSVYGGPMHRITSHSSVKSLELIDCSNVDGKFLSKWRNSTLRFFKISQCDKVDRTDVHTFLYHQNQLVKFSYDGQFLQEYLSLPPRCLYQLEELELNISEATDVQLESIDFGQLQRLTHLTLTVASCGRSRNCDTLLTALSTVDTLQSLTIRRITATADTLNCVGSLTNLRKLRFYESSIRNEFYEFLHLHLPMLEDFHYDGGYYNNESAKSMCKLISSLTSLKIISCNHMNHQLLAAILKLVLSLKRKIVIGIVYDHIDENMAKLVDANPEAVKLTTVPDYSIYF